MTGFSPTISPKAYKDTEQIRKWYDERSFAAADRFLDELNIFSNKAAKSPEHYKIVSPGVKRCLLRKFLYIIFFSEQQNSIVVLRVRHSKQKPLQRYR